MLAFFMLLCGVSAMEPTFHFMIQPRIFRRSEEVCQVCFGNFDCMVISKAGCDYKAEADAIFNEAEEEVIINESIRSDVDTMMYDLMMKEPLHLDFKECVPLISSYTDCHRGNICTGCTKCLCTPEGKWNCSWVQKCRRASVDVNHRVLALVMENLKDDTSLPIRYKRSKDTEDKKDKLSAEELAEWMYGGKVTNESFDIISEKPTNVETKVLKKYNRTEDTAKEIWTTTEKVNKTTEEMKNIAFDEVLREIGMDLKTNMSASNFETNNASINTKKFFEMLSIEEGKEVIKPPGNDTNVIIDLLNDDVNCAVDTGNLISNDLKDKKDGVADFNTDIDVMGYSNLVNIRKREVGHIISTIKTPTKTLATTKIPVSNTYNITTFQNQIKIKVVDPIDKMIQDKYKEIELLNDLKKNLVNLSLMRACNATVCNETQIYYNSSSLTRDSFFRRMFRRNGADLLNRYIVKLKRDLKEVIKSIMGIKKISNNELPQELKHLLQAISIYMKRNLNSNDIFIDQTRTNVKTRPKPYNSRRQLEFSNFNINVNDIKDALLNMFEVLDRDMPMKNALGSLSPGAKKVLKRVINNNYVDDSAVVGFRVNDPKYDIVTELKNIGVIKWHKLTEAIANGPPAYLLYNMKLLYFTLYQDIIKLREAYAILKFSYSRRMGKVNEKVGIEILNSISSNLKLVSNEMGRFGNRGRENKKNKTVKKKMSLLKKIKNLLSNSKKSMIKLLRRENRKNGTEINREKTDENYIGRPRNTMDTWQDTSLENPSRSKRSLSGYEYSKGIPKQRNRMKNIIPQYLRGKLDPALTAKGMSLRKKLYTSTVKPKDRNQKLNKTQKAEKLENNTGIK